MAHNPTTFAGEPGDDRIDWDDAATLHHRDPGLTGGVGLLHGFTALRRSNFADLIRFVAALPEDERRQYMIERAGDRSYEPHEIAALYQRADFPRSKAE
ncbi:MAG: hypothetical protein KGM17_06720 [Sphingomonadales bacterium]|nr:hypothetical protein [Sphingomonadales bacterium]